MRNQRDYKKAVLMCQGFVTCFYLAIGIAVYVMAGQYVASPALGTAGVLLKRIAYGLSLPGLLASGVIYAHLPAKYVSLFAFALLTITLPKLTLHRILALRSLPPRISSPHRQHYHSLGRLALLHPRLRPLRLRYRLCRTRLRRTRRTSRSVVRHFFLASSSVYDVVLRLLGRQERSEEEQPRIQAFGRSQRLYLRHWFLPNGCWYLVSDSLLCLVSEGVLGANEG